MKRLIFITTILTLSLTAQAQDKTKHYGDEVLTKEKFIEVLKPKPRYKTRGIRWRLRRRRLIRRGSGGIRLARSNLSLAGRERLEVGSGQREERGRCA